MKKFKCLNVLFKRSLFFSAFLLISMNEARLCADVPDRYIISHPEGHGELFLGGVYIYNKGAINLDAHLRFLSQQGVTRVLFTPVSINTADPTINELTAMCVKYGLHVSFQLDGGAYVNDLTNLSTKAQLAANFINAFDCPQILDYSVREEPPSNASNNFIDTLLSHYSNITNACASKGYNSSNPVPFYLLHNSTAAITDAYNNTDGQQPAATGADRYFSRWAFSSAGGYIMTPSKTLELLGGSANNGFPQFRAQTRAGQHFTGVITCNVCQDTYAKSYLQATYPANYSEWLTLAQNSNQGLLEDGNNIKAWSYYRPPQNLTRAMVWQAVALGCHSIMNWSCNSSGTSSFVGLMGADFKGSPALNEYTAAIRELQPYGWLINRSVLSSNTGVTTNPSSEMWLGNFTLPGYNAHIVAVVNGHVGTWANGSTTNWLQRSDVFRINSSGDVIDYVPATGTRSITLTNQQGGLGSMYDLSTGTLIGSSSGAITLEPGQGKFVWIGSSADLAAVRLNCGLSGLTKLAGYMNGSVSLPHNIRSIYPVENFSNNSAYSVKFQDIELNRCYRLNITANSSDGALLGAKLIYFDAGWANIHEEHIGIWGQALASTPQTFVSGEFRTDYAGGIYARVYFFRSNSSGTLNINDAWLEDIEHHERITSYYKNYSTINLAPAKTYRVHVKARKLPSAYSNAGLGIYCYNYRPKQGGGYEMYQAVNKYYNLTALEETPDEFVSNTFTAYDGQASYLTVGLYNLHYNRGSGETLVVEKAWAEEVTP
ncbi:MAG: hypothetical protein ACYC4Q_06725 [Victivallaceae bacterium]